MLLVALRPHELGVVGDVRGAGDVVLVPADEVAVLGRHEVLLDDVRAQVQRQLVGAEGVLGAVAAGPAVTDHRRHGEVPQRAVTAAVTAASPLGGVCRAGEAQGRRGEDRGAQKGPSAGTAGHTLRHECSSLGAVLTLSGGARS